MQRSWPILFWFLIHSLSLKGQLKITEENLYTCLEDVKVTTLKNNSLWGVNLYAPILFVDPETRKIYGNEKDSTGILKLSEHLFIGNLPGNVNMANTSVKWSGRHWAMIMLPLPENRNARLNLITHELFHRAQAQLHFESFNVDNNHLDKKEGRIYLRLELEALLKAIESANPAASKIHISNALTFRKLRHGIYPGSDSTENMLELNEGLAEYTGLVMSGRKHEEVIQHFKESIDEFQKNKTFVRSFAYQTIPMYGYLTSQDVRNLWNKDITSKTNLVDYFREAFEVNLPKNLKEAAFEISNKYRGEEIASQEQIRDEANQKLTEDLIKKFVTGPHFEIRLEKMNISFDPGNIISLDNYGTIYPNLRVTDSWGILTVEKGALMSPNWDKITITTPMETYNKIIKGEGWTLELDNDSYILQKDSHSNSYRLIKE